MPAPLQFPAARAVKDALALPGGEDRWLLQVLLLDNDRAAVSLAQCAGVQEPLGGTWPCWHLPAGLADVDIDKLTEPMPSSAYRYVRTGTISRSELLPSDSVPFLPLPRPGNWRRPSIPCKCGRYPATTASTLVSVAVCPPERTVLPAALPSFPCFSLQLLRSPLHGPPHRQS